MDTDLADLPCLRCPAGEPKERRSPVRSPLPTILSLFRRYDREFTCGRCRRVIASVRLGPIGLMRIRHVDGYEVNPIGGAVAIRAAERIVAEATTAAEAASFDDNAAEERRAVGRCRRR